jgi:hypothetical protein
MPTITYPNSTRRNVRDFIGVPRKRFCSPGLTQLAAFGIAHLGEQVIYVTGTGNTQKLTRLDIGRAAAGHLSAVPISGARRARAQLQHDDQRQQ